jgi:hypothetical protein
MVRVILPGMRSFGERVKGAIGLDVGVFEEVEADGTATSQAMTIVILASIASGIGVGLRAGLQGLLLASITSLVGWLLWAGITYFIGTHILPTASTSTSWGELLRTTGFAAAPGLIRILGIIPLLGNVIYFAVSIWMLAAFVIAVRQALDYTSTGRAIAVCLTGWLVFVVVGVFLVPFSR